MGATLVDGQWVSRVARKDAACPEHEECRRRVREIAWETLLRQCWLCLRPLTRETMTLDHALPLHHGGIHCIDNLLLADLSCNSWRRDRLLADLPWE